MNLDYLESLFWYAIKIYNEEEQQMIKRAYYTAKSLHGKQLRKSGEPYIIHPLNVALLLVTYKADVDVICAGLLHDILEDTPITFNQLASIFNYSIANLVDGVTKINLEDKNEKELFYHRKIINYFCIDPRVIIIKFADRLHNMRTIKYLKPLKQQEQAKENFALFIPLAYLLGAYEMKNLLEDLSFEVLDKEAYESINSSIQYYKRQHFSLWLILIEKMEKIFQEHNINIVGNMRFNMKNIYGVYNRYQKEGSLKNIHDLVAFRIICERPEECYQILNIIHKLFPVEEIYEKDYIKNPKTNGYRSLHTTVKINEEYLQFQIRTKKMELQNASGIASFFELYKENALEQMQIYLQEESFFYQAFIEMTKNIKDNKEFLAALKNDFLGQNIHVYDTFGKCVELPMGSTLVDFAYHMKDEIGNQLVGGVVNGSLVNIDYVLKDKDYVDTIIGDRINPPSIDLANTIYAKEKIKKLKKASDFNEYKRFT